MKFVIRATVAGYLPACEVMLFRGDSSAVSRQRSRSFEITYQHDVHRSLPAREDDVTAVLCVSVVDYDVGFEVGETLRRSTSDRLAPKISNLIFLLRKNQPLSIRRPTSV